ncbi:citrate synthase-like protein [Phakopsora pachyrhizi]|nr:citrate synthase-like protein [Phakopsora pachyrhizi]
MVDQVHLFQAKPGRLLLVSNSHTFIAQTLHPMTLFVIATAALNHDSKFAAAYSAGVKKTDYWKSTLEDLLNLAAMTYPIAARIYVSKYKEAVKLYNALHTNHEGGNVSSHTTHLVGSALSDPFLSYSAALGLLKTQQCFSPAIQEFDKTANIFYHNRTLDPHA